ncbi:MAG: hypothetical protein CL785_02855 [Chloroflexi bacterium]|nr:hypothetical protein [Chloroflexota bacterium]|tara:strand:+ start:4757 stop:5683 length:927 start_codon:yes stop_codon:yes gene_type:complete
MSIGNFKNLVIEADDLGLTTSINRGILHGYQHGILQSTCIRSNGPAFTHAVEDILPICPNLGVGIHLNLVEGPGEATTEARDSKLYDISGRYRNSFLSLLIGCKLQNQKLLNEIKTDYRLQIEKVLSAGIRIDHINSHQHSHVIPELFKIVCLLAREYKIPYVRLTKERFHISTPNTDCLSRWYQINLAKLMIVNKFSIQNEITAGEFNIKTNDYFLGVTYAGHMNSTHIKTGLRKLNSKKPKLVEVLLHPCIFLPEEPETYISPSIKSYVSAIERQKELAALLDPELIEFIDKNNWNLRNFRGATIQ